MKGIWKVVQSEFYAFTHNLKAFFFALFALFVSLGLLSGISLSKGQLSSLNPTSEDYSQLRSNYEENRDLFAYDVAYLDGENPPLPSGGAALPDPQLYSFYVQELRLYEYLLKNEAYLFYTVFTLADPDDPMAENYRENYAIKDSAASRAIVSVASGRASLYFSLGFALVIGYLVFAGRHAQAARKNEANSPLSSQTCQRGKLLFSFLLMSAVNLGFLLLSLLLGLPSAFAPLFLVYVRGGWQSVPAVLVLVSDFLASEALAFLLLSLYGLFPKWEGKKRFLPLAILGGCLALSFGAAFLLARYSLQDKLLFYFLPFANLVFVPYGFYHWTYWLLFALAILFGFISLFLAEKKETRAPRQLSRP
jgi:hypothetical protein